MKYLFLKNSLEIKKNIFKFYIIQILLLGAYLIINKSAIQYLGLTEYATILGLKEIKDAYILHIFLKCVTYLILLYIIVRIFTNSILKTMPYVMLRIDSKKWIFYEMLNFTFYIIGMRLLFNLLLLIGFVLFKGNLSFSNFIYFMVKDMLFSISLSLLVVLALNLFSLKKYGQVLALFPVVFFLASLFIDLSKIPFLIYLLCIVFLFVLNIILFSPSRFYDTYWHK